MSYRYSVSKHDGGLLPEAHRESTMPFPHSIDYNSIPHIFLLLADLTNSPLPPFSIVQHPGWETALIRVSRSSGLPGSAPFLTGKDFKARIIKLIQSEEHAVLIGRLRITIRDPSLLKELLQIQGAIELASLLLKRRDRRCELA